MKQKQLDIEVAEDWLTEEELAEVRAAVIREHGGTKLTTVDSIFWQIPLYEEGLVEEVTKAGQVTLNSLLEELDELRFDSLVFEYITLNPSQIEDRLRFEDIIGFINFQKTLDK